MPRLLDDKVISALMAAHDLLVHRGFFDRLLGRKGKLLPDATSGG